MNYYSPNNGVLTQSKIKDFLKDKEYFYRKHISGELEQRISDPMKVGSAVDCWLTEGKKKFKETFYVPEGNRKQNAEDYEYQLTQAMMDEVTGICKAVEQTSIYKDIKKKFRSQEMLFVEFAEQELGEHFHSLAGIPDWIKTNKKTKTCTIIDYKTAQSINVNKYYYTCLDFGYFMQQAMYQKLVEAIYPWVTRIDSYNLVTEKDPDKIYRTALFHLSPDKIEQERYKLDQAINDISMEEEFKKEDLTWNDYHTIGDDPTKII